MALMMRHISDLGKPLQLYQLRFVSKEAFSMHHMQWSFIVFILFVFLVKAIVLVKSQVKY